MTGNDDKKSQGATETPLYFRGTYDEAFDLLVEARNYVERHVPAFKYSDDPPDPVAMTKETLRLTSRLTQVMAWLMAQRALQDGEIGADEFVEDKYRLEGHDICLKRAFEDLEELPEGLNDLMSRSYELYSRVMRLDEQYADPNKRN